MNFRRGIARLPRSFGQPIADRRAMKPDAMGDREVADGR